MAAVITTLIDKQDTCEVIRDQIAAILAVEESSQKELAVIDGQDPLDYAFTVFIERARPWKSSQMPCINIIFDNDRFDNRNSDVIQRQRAVGTFYIDCYATKNNDDSGTADELSSKEADRIARLVRNILMSGEYTYLLLGHRELGKGNNIVTKRYITRREKFMPEIRQEGYENIIACRLTVEVEYDEFSPQVEMNDFELLIHSCMRDDDKVYFVAEYDVTEE